MDFHHFIEIKVEYKYKETRVVQKQKIGLFNVLANMLSYFHYKLSVLQSGYKF